MYTLIYLSSDSYTSHGDGHLYYTLNEEKFRTLKGIKDFIRLSYITQYKIIKNAEIIEI